MVHKKSEKVKNALYLSQEDETWKIWSKTPEYSIHCNVRQSKAVQYSHIWKSKSVPADVKSWDTNSKKCLAYTTFAICYNYKDC